MTREQAINELTQLLHEDFLSEYAEAIRMAIKALELESESRMKYVKEAVYAILNTCDTDSIADNAMRNAAKFVQNAIDGSYPDFEKLEQEPCEDCISREEALKALMDEWTEFDSELIDYLIEKIDKLPSVAPQPRWIPVETALPEWGVNVLVYAERNAYGDKGQFKRKVIDIGWQCGGDWHIDGCNGVVGIAWMPLPEPYKANTTGQIVANGELYPGEFDDTLAEEGGRGRMSKKSKPFLAHSELTDCIYIIDGNDKYEVTEQCIKAMKATNRMPNVLDKIRSEVTAIAINGQVDEHTMFIRTGEQVKQMALEIIDKYMAEGSEE